MKQQQIDQQIAKLFNFDKVSKDLIFKKNNRYFAFTNYVIEKKSSSSRIQVIKKNPVAEQTFVHMRTAISWCIADKLRNFRMSSRICELDRRYSVLCNDIAVEQEILTKLTDPARRDIVSDKVLEKRNALRHVKKQLTNCVNWAKYWQIKGFVSNETARP